MSEQAGPGQSRVLVVDDHELSRKFTLAALRECRVSVKQARHAGEALSLALSWLPHFIFMDIVLPGLDGPTAIGRILARWPHAHQYPKIIVLTADRAKMEQAVAAGLQADELLIKPVSARRIRRIVVAGAGSSVAECGPQDGGTDLSPLLGRELAQTMPVLAQCLAAHDHRRALGLLHKLIAAAAICGQPALESALRRLDRAVRHEAGPARVAHACSLLLEAWQEFSLQADRSGFEDERFHFADRRIEPDENGAGDD